jgi:hypothetical protein
MMDGFRILLGGIQPGFADLQNKEIVAVHEARIGHLAFEVGRIRELRRLSVVRNFFVNLLSPNLTSACYVA